MSLILLLNQAAAVPANIGVKTTSTVTVETSVERAPFSEHGIADRVQEDPEAYRRLAAFVASNLQRDIDRMDAITVGSDTNSVAVIKGELKRLQEGFQQVATTIPQEGLLTREAAEKVGRIISTLRTGFAAWYEGNKEIAEFLNISVKTAETHRANIMLKLNFHSITELVRYAVRNHIIQS